MGRIVGPRVIGLSLDGLVATGSCIIAGPVGLGVGRYVGPTVVACEVGIDERCTVPEGWGDPGGVVVGRLNSMGVGRAVSDGLALGWLDSMRRVGPGLADGLAEGDVLTEGLKDGALLGSGMKIIS